MKFWPFSKAPVAVVERASPVPRVRSQRSYNAAGMSARYGDFKRSNASADGELLNSLGVMRDRTRSLARNSPTMVRYIQLMQDNVVGDAGFQFRCRVKKNDGKLDKTLNERVEMAWWRWLKTPTVDGQMTGVDVMEQMVETWARDGEYFIEMVRGPFNADMFALNPLEADMCDETLNGVHSPTGNQIRMGVEINEYGKPVAYHMFEQHPGDPGWYNSATKVYRRHRRVEASRILHIYMRKRPGQTRGEPPAASVINSIKMLDGYREAEVTGRRVQSAVMGFFKRDLPGPGGIDALATHVSDEDEAPKLEMELEPGVFKELPAGMSFEKFEAKGATTDYKQFEGQLKRDQSMGLNISAFSLGMETDGVSYSTGRSVLIEDRDHYRRSQRFFINPWLKIFEKWLDYHTLSASTEIPPSRVKAIKDNYSITGRGWGWLDPAKDIKANAEALRTRQTSLSRLAAERGLDFPDLIQEIADDEAMMKDLGLTLTIVEELPEPVEDEKDPNGETLQPED